jgi:hypothetical protein
MEKAVMLLCPTCKKEVVEHHIDDVQTWYSCKNGHQTAKPIQRKLDELQSIQRAIFGKMEEYADKMELFAASPDLEKRFLDDIHRTVAEHDDHVTKANFYTALSMYNIAVNNSVKGEPGSGKTYGTLEVIKYFPEEDIQIIGSQSPKVISHEYGELMTGNAVHGPDEPFSLDDAPIKPKLKNYDGDKQEFKEACDTYKHAKLEWEHKLKNSYYLIRLTGRTFVFLDTISRETFEMFKTVLSHDKQRIPHKYVDQKGNVHTTVLEGWPSSIFCTVDKYWLSEFSTRTFTVSPSTAKEKIGAGMEITSHKACYPWEYEKNSDDKELLKALIREIRSAFEKHKLKVVCPFPNIEKLFTSNATRDMRDFNHFTEILPAYTMFSIFQRPIVVIGKQKYLVVSLDDVKAAKTLFDEIAETTKTGTERRVIDFYENYVKSRVNGVTLKVLVDKYNFDNPTSKKSSQALRRYLSRLIIIDWVDVKKRMQEDQRELTFYPLKLDAKKEISANGSKNGFEIDLERKLRKVFKTWLETISAKQSVAQYEILDFRTKEPVPLTVDQFVQKTVGVSID